MPAIVTGMITDVTWFIARDWPRPAAAAAGGGRWPRTYRDDLAPADHTGVDRSCMSGCRCGPGKVCSMMAAITYPATGRP
jgi:hypothetical protein